MFGSQFLYYSQAGAKAVLRGIEEKLIHFGHWDLALKNFLVKHGDRIECSMFWPPMGHFTSHPSGCDPGKHGQMREGSVDEPWVCHGTRVDDDPEKRHKWLCKMFKKGTMDWKHNVSSVVDCTHYFWKTCSARLSQDCELPP